VKILLGAILLLLVGCSGVVQAQGNDTDAQIAALTERVELLEAENELQWGIIEGIASDPVRRQLHWRQVALEFDEEAPALTRIYFPDASGNLFDFYLKHMLAYGSAYLLLGCLEGVEPSPLYFRDAARRVGGATPGDASNFVIGLLVDEIDRLERTGEKPSPCLKTYISPEYMAEGKLAIDLATRMAQSNVPTRFRGGLDSVYGQIAATWFDESDRQIPFLCWLFGGSDGDLEGDPCERLVEDKQE
jgi:hypothetical protein